MPLSELNEEWPKEQAEIVVPIKFNGRVLGAIEVASFDRWRFRWGQRMLLINIATSLGAYWYQQRHLSSLSNIQSKVLEFDQDKCDEETLYNSICEQSAVLFLCMGAGLWIRDKNNHDLFIRKGGHVIDLQQKDLLISKKDNLISWFVCQKKNNSFRSYLHSEIVFNSKRLSQNNRKHLQNEFIQHLALIPIYKNKEKFDIIAFLALYDRSNRGFDESWRYIAKFYSGHLHVIIDSVAAFSKQQESVKKMILHQVTDSASHLIDKSNKITKPVSPQVSRLDKIYSALSAPKVSERLKTATILGEIPENISLPGDLQQTIYQLKTHYVLPNKDIKEYGIRLRHQINAFSYDFKQGYETLLKKHYKNEPEKIPMLLNKARSIMNKTSDDNFLYFLISEKLLDMKTEPVNLKTIINQISTGSDFFVPYDSSTVNSAITLNINRNALNYVLTNLWVNAQKYRTNKEDAILWDAREATRFGGCILEISNPSQEYSDKELIKLTEKGYQHSIAKKSHTIEGYNEGLGLYLVDNICRHLLGIGFEIKQPRNTQRKDFICELTFNPKFIIRDN